MQQAAEMSVQSSNGHTCVRRGLTMSVEINGHSLVIVWLFKQWYGFEVMLVKEVKHTQKVNGIESNSVMPRALTCLKYWWHVRCFKVEGIIFHRSSFSFLCIPLLDLFRYIDFHRSCW